MRGFVDDAVARVGTGETDVTGVARRGEQAGGELGAKVRRRAWSGGGSKSVGCVQVVAASLLGKIALVSDYHRGPAVAVVIEVHGHARRIALAGLLRGPASEIDVGACLCWAGEGVDRGFPPGTVAVAGGGYDRVGHNRIPSGSPQRFVV